MTTREPASIRGRGASQPPSTQGALGDAARATLPLILANAVGTISLGIGAVLAARGLGPSQRGQLALYVAIQTWLTLLGTAGIGTAARLQLGTSRDRETPTLTLGEFNGAILLLALLQIAVCPLAGWLLLPLAHIRASGLTLAFLAVLSASKLASYLLLQGMMAYGLMLRTGLIDAIGSAGQLLGIAILFCVGDHSASDYLGAMAGIAALHAGVAQLLTSRVPGYSRPRPTRSSFLRLIRQGLPAIGVSLGQSITFDGDQYVVGLYLPSSAVGHYSVAEGAAEMLRIVPYAVSQVVFHRVAAGVFDRKASALVRRVAVAAYALVGGVAALVAYPLFRLVFGDAYLPGVVPFLILILAELGISLYLLNVSDRLPRGGLAWSSALSMGGMALTLSLDFILIKRYGINGAAWASVFGYWSMGLASIAVLPRAGN